MRDVRKGGCNKERYLVFDVFQTDGEIDCETDENDIGFGVREGSQSIVFSSGHEVRRENE